MNTRCCCVKLECQEDPCETEQNSCDCCVCELPCNTCVCVKETKECCPPRASDCEDPCEDFSKPSYIQTECVEKPKKSFWQQLFSSEKKCCSSLKKKCGCKREKKQVCKCAPCCENLKCQEIKSKNKCKPCECNSKMNTCAQKPCMPSRKSICGCHFYINLENRPTHKKCCCKSAKPILEDRDCCPENETSETYGYNVHEQPVRDNDTGVVRRSLLKSRLSEPGLSQNRKSKLSQCCLKEKKPEDKKVHIGVTVTKEEKKYYKPNVQVCQNKQDVSSCEISNSSGEESNENVDNITVKINNSGVRVTKKDQCEETNNKKCLKDNHCKSQERRTVIETQTSNVQRESQLDQSCHQLRCSRRKSRLSGHKILDLDKRVSEILRKLDCIEQKICTLETNKTDNKAIRIDFDGQKSMVSLQLRDCENNCIGNRKNTCNSNRDKSTSVKCKRKSLIKIKRSKSSSCIAVPTKQPKTNRNVCSKSLERCCQKESSCQKIIISLPSDKDKSRQFVVMPGNDKTCDKIPNNNRVGVSWCDISKDLQSSKCSKRICYCIECCQKRTRCI